MQEPAGITAYADPTSEWEPWCEAYRYGALYLFPPPPVRSRVNALRQRHDPRSQAICDAHVSLTVPLPRPLSPLQAAEVASVLRTIPSFEITWGPVHQYPGVPGVVLQVAPASRLQQLVTRLEACTCFQGAAARPYPFSPHMTIAEFISMEQSEVLLVALEGEGLQGRFWCTEVAYAVPDAAFHFTERQAWPLGPGGERPGSRERAGVTA
jgi:2'-5' RNA ligase